MFIPGGRVSSSKLSIEYRTKRCDAGKVLSQLNGAATAIFDRATHPAIIIDHRCEDEFRHQVTVVPSKSLPGTETDQ